MIRVWQGFRKHWMVILGLVLSIATICAFFWGTDGVSKLREIYRQLRYEWLVIALALMALQWLFDAAGLHLLVTRHSPAHRFADSFIATMVGVLYSAITPSATGGQPMQVLTLRKQGVETGTATSVIVLKTVLYQIAITLCALLMVIWELPFFQQNVSKFSFIVLFALLISVAFIVGLIFFMVNQSFTRKAGHGIVNLLGKMRLCRDPQKLHDKLDAQFEQFFVSTGALAGSWKRCVATLLLTLCQLISFFLVPYCVYRSFGLSGQPMIQLFAAATFVYLASMFVPVPGASGGAEGSFYLFFDPFFPDGRIATAMLIWRLITYYGSIIIGCAFTMLTKNKKEDHAEAPLE